MAQAVLDVGKTLAKLTIWDDAGLLLARRTRPNPVTEIGGLRRLDAPGIETWLADNLRLVATEHHITRIFPVGHGAAAAIIKGDRLVTPPVDYEQTYDAAERQRYDAVRAPFAITGSPALPAGLNLGMQLFHLTAADPALLDDATILPWPQYWAWRLSGVAAIEATSMGCHTDLWDPVAAAPSPLAHAMGWAAHFAPLARAGDVLGCVTPEWVERCGLDPACVVHCGIHDSNAALLAARAFPEILDHESTVLSTGTWFIAMRSPPDGAAISVSSLPEERDCLVNVDAFGKPVPSARFMGGREIESQIEIDTRRVDIKPDQPALLAAVPELLASGAMLLPTMAPGSGPFPDSAGRWINQPRDWFARRAATCLYAALVADVSLALIGTRERLLVEGRFAEAEVFVRALASLRPDLTIYVANEHNDVAFGALRLINPDLAPADSLRAVVPLDADLSDYRARWHAALSAPRVAA